MDVSAGSGAVALPMPDVLLDADRLQMLLDLVCADYITASYASRENGKKVLVKALEKLQLSVHAAAAAPVSLSSVRQDPVFAERVRAFYDDVMHDFAAKRLEQQQQQQTHTATTGSSSFVLPPPSPRVMEDALVRDVLRPRLLQVVEEMCKERDRQLAASLGAAVYTSANSTGGSTRSLFAGLTASSTGVMNSSGANNNNSSSTGGLPASQGLSGALLPTAGEIRMEGWLRKKGQHVTLWRERYFMIRSTPNGSHYLCYFRKKGDKDPRGWYVLGPGTTVDEVRESPSKIETKRLFTFRIRHLAHATSEDVEDATAAPSSSTIESSNATMVLPPAFTPSRAAAQDFPSSPDAASMAATEFDMDHHRSSAKKHHARRFRSRAAAAAAAATAATAVVLTGGLAGVGIGMGMGMSAAAAASAGAAGAMIAQSRSKGPIALAAESLETAVWWRNSILECIAQAEEQWKRYLNWYMDREHDQYELDSDVVVDNFVATPGQAVPPFLSHSGHTLSGSSLLSTSSGVASTTRPRSGSFGTVPRSIAKTFRTSATFSQETTWKLYDFSSKIRVDVERAHQHSSSSATAPPPALRTSMRIMASPRKVFELLMQPDSSFYKSNHVIEHARILEEHKEDHSDVVYWQLAPTFLWPCQVAARDLCLLRYWRKEQDSSYFICFQSTTHTQCPHNSSSAAVRASVMGGGFIISPRVHAEENFEECWVTLTIQMNPKGWIDSALARSWYYMHAYGVYFLEMITALASSTALKAHQSLHLQQGASGDHTQSSNSSSNSSRYPESTVSTTAPSSQLIVSETTFPMLEPFRTDLAVEHALPTKFWSEPSASGFFVRSAQFLSTSAKVPSARQLLRLVSVELYRSNEPIEHIGLSSFAGFDPKRDSGAGGLAPPNDEFQVLIINFMIPGPPHHSLVLYFTPEDPAELTTNAPFAELVHQLFHGADDDFCSKRLKLIPRVVQGTWPIREGVGTTPAILGTKTYQKYFRGKQFLEVDYDIGSSTVAASIAKLLLGYSRDLVIDLAFVIEGQTRLELPERVLGCVRLDCIDLRHAVPFKHSTAKDLRS